MNYYLDVLKKYATFGGRARRKEYWMFALFNIIIAAVLIGVAFAIDQNLGMIVYVGYILALLLPGLAVAVRRLHDQGKSGAWIFITFVPFIGGIWLLVLMCLEGTRGPNQYGPDPKAIGA